MSRSHRPASPSTGPAPRRAGGRRPTSGDADRPAEPTRKVDKGRTRRLLLDGALDLLEDRSLDNLGIREVTRAAGVAPAAFYRHFASTDDLGLVLVEEAFTTLREMMRDAREGVTGTDDIIRRSAAVLVEHLHAHPAHYRFIAREQYSAVLSVRLAIRRDLRLFATELATDLARTPVVAAWSTADLVMLAELIVGLMVDTAKRLLDAMDEAPEREPEIVADAERRLRYLALGATAWHPRTS